MLDNETYQQELIRMLDSLRKTHKGELSCDGIHCDDCPFSRPCKHPFSVFASCNIVEKWSKEHPRPKYKVSQMEYDILCTALDYNSAKDTIFDDFYMLNDLLEKGYFKGATLETNVGDYFDNCEVVDK